MKIYTNIYTYVYVQYTYLAKQIYEKNIHGAVHEQNTLQMQHNEKNVNATTTRMRAMPDTEKHKKQNQLQTDESQIVDDRARDKKRRVALWGGKEVKVEDK